MKVKGGKERGRNGGKGKERGERKGKERRKREGKGGKGRERWKGKAGKLPAEGGHVRTRPDSFFIYIYIYIYIYILPVNLSQTYSPENILSYSLFPTSLPSCVLYY